MGADGFGKVLFGIREFFCHVCDGVRGADGECAVQDASQESDATAPTGVVVEVLPDEAVAGMFGGHGGKDDDGHDAANRDDEEAELLQVREVFVEEDGDCNADPCDAEETYKDVPMLDHVVRMIQEVHLNAQFGHDVNDGGEVEKPAEVVQRAGIEAPDTAIFGSWSDGSPMVDAARGWDSRSELTRPSANANVVRTSIRLPPL